MIFDPLNDLRNVHNLLKYISFYNCSIQTRRLGSCLPTPSKEGLRRIIEGKQGQNLVCGSTSQTLSLKSCTLNNSPQSLLSLSSFLCLVPFSICSYRSGLEAEVGLESLALYMGSQPRRSPFPWWIHGE